MKLPPYRHPQGRPDAPCGHCGAQAAQEPVFTPDFVSCAPRAPYRRYAPDPSHAPVLRCLTCWQRGQGFVGDDFYKVRDHIERATFDQGGDWTFVNHPLDLDDTPPEKCMVSVDRHVPMSYAPAPPRIPDSFEADLEHHVEHYLLASGMTAEHLRAVISKVPVELTGALTGVATATMNTLLDGEFPERGILLGGGAGGGKTSAIAAGIIGFVTNRMRLLAPLRGWRDVLDSNDFQWLDWPEQYAAWNHPKFEWHLDNAVHQFGTQVRLLVVDDVSAETPFKTFGRDQGTTALERVIALRDSNRLPTFFTTNMESSDMLFERYGDRTGRRIERLNDAFYIKDLPFLDD
jgi:hypothetical protein